jgi:phosphate/sulfate permease
MELTSWFLSSVGALGAYLAGKKRIGWAIGFLYQVLWIPYAIVTHQYGFIWICVIFATIYAKNFYEWEK